MTDYRKSLQTQRSEIFSYELNTFIVLSAKKTVDSVDDTIFKKLEEGKPRKRLEKYYREIGSRLRKYLKHNQELRETSRIIKDFLKGVDSTLIKKFNERLKEMNRELPKEYCEIYSKSYVTLWSIEENQKHQITLSAFDSPIFTNETPKTPVEMERFFDKLIVVNFSAAFLKPTIIRLQAIDQVLEKLNEVLIGTHYKSSDQQLQAKQEWFLRILEAKLSALQDVGTLVSRVLDQFRYPLPLLSELDFQNASQNLNAELETIESDIASGEKLLTRVCKNLPQSQIQLREYFSEDKNEVVTISTSEEFKRTHLTIAELSIELFTEAELLKMWLDTFASDIQYFSFNTPLFDSPSSSRIKVASDTILAARGLVKNYSLGRTTAYAVRGVDLDIKEGEFVAIVGSSGAGKTTLLNCLAGLDTPDHGVVLFHGENLHDKNDAAKSAARLHEMGFIFQSYALLPHFDTR
ncbi:MAG: ATP-binding cassette domain-containing protein, partial [Candidatus Bathyarchaeota archaeon]